VINGGAINAVPLNGVYEEEFVDWAADIDPVTSSVYYALEIDDGVLDAVRIPMSSWQATIQSGRASFAQAVIPAALSWVDTIQATIQSGRASFAQAVIPAALSWVDTISDRSDGEFIVYRGVTYSDGETQESELARAPLQTVRLDQGPTNATMTISGYQTQTLPTGTITRTLQNVRSQSSGNGFRVRCDVDWFLRPGYQAIARETEFTVAYINYYVNTDDEYMDVGERNT